jgi:hypothetical protein
MFIDVNKLLSLCIVIIIILTFGVRGIFMAILLGWFLLTFPIFGGPIIGSGLVVGSRETPKIQKIVDDFPYKRLNMKFEDIKNRFDRLKTYKFQIVPQKYFIKNIRPEMLQYDGKQMVIDQPKSYYEEYDNISDYFIEPARIRCIRSDQQQSVHQYWMANKSAIMKHCKNKYKKINTHNLRESVFDLVYECNTFKPSLLVGFVKLFNAKSILDISAGWGDRLIGAMAAEVDYTGVDPADLHSEYKSMIKLFDHKSSTTLIKGKFEDPDVKFDTKVDMIFSSPPFYDLEKYTDHESQSYMNRSLESWFKEFLMVSIKKAWTYLVDGGHMVLYMADAYNRTPYVQRMIDEVAKISGAVYLGCLPQMDLTERKPRPFWIWKKDIDPKNGGMDLIPGIIGY